MNKTFPKIDGPMQKALSKAGILVVKSEPVEAATEAERQIKADQRAFALSQTHLDEEESESHMSKVHTLNTNPKRGPLDPIRTRLIKSFGEPSSGTQIAEKQLVADLKKEGYETTAVILEIKTLETEHIIQPIVGVKPTRYQVIERNRPKSSTLKISAHDTQVKRTRQEVAAYARKRKLEMIASGELAPNGRKWPVVEGKISTPITKVAKVVKTKVPKDAPIRFAKETLDKVSSSVFPVTLEDQLKSAKTEDILALLLDALPTSKTFVLYTGLAKVFKA